jgi:hypothetical protein
MDFTLSKTMQEIYATPTVNAFFLPNRGRPRAEPKEAQPPAFPMRRSDYLEKFFQSEELERLRQQANVARA